MKKKSIKKYINKPNKYIKSIGKRISMIQFMENSMIKLKNRNFKS